MNKIEGIAEKISKFVEVEVEYANEYGKSSFATCNHSNWNRDIWAHRHSIMDKIRSRGFNVTSETNHGVLDVSVVKIF